MNSKMRVTIISILLLTQLTGCWNSREINELSIAIAMGIDKDEEGYLVTTQLINSGEIATDNPTTRTPATTYRNKGKTIFEALRRLTLETPRKIYVGHIRCIIYGEEFAKEGIQSTLDFFIRDHEVRSDYYMLVAKDQKAEKLLNILTPVEKVPGNKISYAIKMSEKAWGSISTITLDELAGELLSEGKEPVLAGVQYKGDPDIGMNIKNLENVDVPTTIQLKYLSAFKGDKLVGWFTEEEGVGYNYIMGKVKSAIITIPCDDKHLSIECIRTNASIKAECINKEPQINIDLWVEANVADVQCNVDLSNPDVITLLEKQASSTIEMMMKKAVKKAQDEFRSDVFGFGRVIYRNYPKEWKKIKDQWDDYFSSLKVNYKVKLFIRRLGTISKSINEN